MSNYDDPSSYYSSTLQMESLGPANKPQWRRDHGLAAHPYHLAKTTLRCISYSCSSWSPPKISSTTRSTGTSTKMTGKSVLDTVLQRTYTSSLSRKTRRNSHLRCEVRVYPRRPAHRRSCWCRPGVRQARRCVGCTVCAEGARGTVVCRGSITATVLNEDDQTTPPINLIFSLQPDAPPLLPSS